MQQNRPAWRRPLIIAIILALLVGGFFIRYEMPHVQLPAEPIAHIGPFTLTNTILATWITILILVGFFRAATSRMRLVPGRLQNLAEIFIETFMGLCISVAGERNGRRFFALVTTIFIFVLTANWLGLLPGFGSIGIWEHDEHGATFVPLLRGATSDLNTTLALALISVIAFQVYGIRTLGAGEYLSRFFNFRGGPIGLFVGILEFISEIAKVLSFSFRLFGNIFAGEVLLAVIAFLVPFIAAIPFYGLELFVGVVQAFIFSMLTLVFLTMATMGHGKPHEEAAEHGH